MKVYTHDDVSGGVAFWASKLGISRQGLHNRLQLVENGRLDLAEALTAERIQSKPKLRKRRPESERWGTFDYEKLKDGKVHTIDANPEDRPKLQLFCRENGYDLSMRTLEGKSLVRLKSNDNSNV